MKEKTKRTILKIILVISCLVAAYYAHKIYIHHVRNYTKIYYTINENGNTVYDLDKSFGYFNSGKEPDIDKAQSYIDKGIVTEYLGDFYHHNTESFKNMVRGLKEDDVLIINKNSHFVDHLEKAYCEWDEEENGEGFVITETGKNVFYDNITELIICEEDPYWNRLVVVLKN